MSLQKEIADLMEPGWGQAAPDREMAWAREAMKTVMALAADPDNHVAIAAFLSALQLKGAKGSHLAGFSLALRSLGRSIDFGHPRVIDTCGTGGGIPSLNLSTGAALLSAAAGVKVAKHGNRGVTSSCGSADILEALGIRITSDESRLRKCMDRAGFAFLFAPHFYEAIGWVRPVRTRIGMRTVFNQLGPLLNPAGATRQIVGVFQPSLLVPTAEALALLGTEKAWVVHGSDGMDEISPASTTLVAEVAEGRVASVRETAPGADYPPASDPAGYAPSSTPAEGAERIMRGLTDPAAPEFAALLPTAMTAIHLAMDVPLSEARERAEEAARSGRARDIVKALAEETQD